MLILAKLAATPLLILTSMLLARVFGPMVGGLVAGLPFISGPASMFIAAELGPAFAAAAASSALLGASASCVYCLVYAHCATRTCWIVSLCAGLLAFALVALLLWWLHLPFWLAALLSGIVPLLFLPLLPKTCEQGSLRTPQPRWRLPLQMVCGGLSVLLLTWLAGVLGEVWGGILLTFPIISSVITPFVHASYGGGVAVLTIRGLLTGFVATSAFTVVVAVSLLPLGTVLGYSIAVAATLAISALSLFAQRLHAKYPSQSRGSSGTNL